MTKYSLSLSLLLLSYYLTMNRQEETEEDDCINTTPFLHFYPSYTHPSPHFLQKECTQASNIYEFDEAVIVGKAHPQTNKPYLHFPTVEDYYTRSSCINYTHNITLPTLVISTEDDPVCNSQAIPKNILYKHQGIRHAPAISSSTAIMITPIGGHVGFGYGIWSTRYMTDEAALRFFNLLQQHSK